MKRILIFGNSGSGKSTLAKKLCVANGLVHLDLDTLAWQASTPPKRAPIEQSGSAIRTFIDTNESWVIEGCYADLLALAIESSNEVIFMNLPVNYCIDNARSRPWEPHKYESKADQDANLDMLTSWIAQYPERNDVFSKSAHLKLYLEYAGAKRMYSRNETQEGAGNEHEIN